MTYQQIEDLSKKKAKTFAAIATALLCIAPFITYSVTGPYVWSNGEQIGIVASLCIAAIATAFMAGACLIPVVVVFFLYSGICNLLSSFFRSYYSCRSNEHSFRKSVKQALKDTF
jgi:hypothetical protein